MLTGPSIKSPIYLLMFLRQPTEHIVLPSARRTGGDNLRQSEFAFYGVEMRQNMIN